MNINRRNFLAGTGALALASACSNKHAMATREIAETQSFVPNPIAVSTYSFWRYRDDTKLTIPECIDLAAEMGFDGVEILKIQMENESNGYLQKLKRQAFINGLDLCGMSTHQDFVAPDAGLRQKNVDDTIGYIELAYKLGIPTIRVNTGRWRTVKSFDELMKNKGIEPRLEGYTDEDGFKWVIDSLSQCLKKAEECGVVMGLENHWGLGSTAEGVLRIIKAIDSPWLQATMDTGNFFERREEQLEMMAPHTVLVQAKTYFGGGTWYELDIDYDRVAQIIQRAGFHGYISLEFEGKEDFQTAVPQSLKLLRHAFGKKQS